MSGSFADMLDREAQWSVLSDINFGRVWIARAVVMLAVRDISCVPEVAIEAKFRAQERRA